MASPAAVNTVALQQLQVTSAWGAVSNLLANNAITIINVVLVVVTIGGQTLLKKLSFSCPCAYPLNIYSSLLFIVAPSLALFILGVSLNNTTWRLLHGCVFRHRDTRHRMKTACVYWIEVFGKSSIAPMAWLFVAFLDGSYYQCLRAAPYCSMNLSTQCLNDSIYSNHKMSESFDDISGNGMYCPLCICNMTSPDASYLQSISRITAWSLLFSYGLFAFLVICCIRMCDKYTLIQRTYVDTYKSEEEEKFRNIAREHAAQLAESNARAFFTNIDWSKRDWDWVSGVPEISNPFVKVSGVPEISNPFVKVSGVPEISNPFVKVSGVPEISNTLVKVSGVPEISNPLVKDSGVPEISNPFVKVSGMPEISNPLVKVSGVPEILNPLVKVSGVPEISNPLVKVSGVPEISNPLVKVSGVPEISNPLFVRVRMIEKEKAQTTLYTPLQLWTSHHGYRIQKPDVELPSLEEERKDV